MSKPLRNCLTIAKKGCNKLHFRQPQVSCLPSWPSKRLSCIPRSYATASQRQAPSFQDRMSAWQIHSYGSSSELTLCHDIQTPHIHSPCDVLVEVHAASVNPIDTMMIGGYGSATLNALRQMNALQCSSSKAPEFPLTPGRDFSGVVVATGKDVPPNKFKPGDEVWGAGEAWKPGTHAEYLTVSSKQISRKPSSLTHIESASFPYVAATTWAALCTFGWLTPGRMHGKRVLILGGSGGIGTFAIQLVRAWGADVTTTCSTDAVELVLSLGAHVALDYTTQDAFKELSQLHGFDVILDGTGTDPKKSVQLLKKYANAKYISFVTPFLKNNDALGVPWGMLKTGISFGASNLQALQEGRSVRYALFLPNGNAMREVAKLVDHGKIRPVLEKVYNFESLPEAYDHVTAKHNRGKTVMDMKGAYVQDCGELEDTL